MVEAGVGATEVRDGRAEPLGATRGGRRRRTRRGRRGGRGRGRPRLGRRPARSAAASQPAASAPRTPRDRLAPPDAVVQNGDRVRGQGGVVALPGRPVRLCSGGGPQTGVDVAFRGPIPTPAYCPVGITLVGADLDRLGARQERDGAVWGTAEVTGVYRDRTITVTGQRVPPVTDLEQQKPLTDEFPADCHPPAGGWPQREVQDMPGIDRADQYVAAHPDVLGSLSIAYPKRTRPARSVPRSCSSGRPATWPRRPARSAGGTRARCACGRCRTAAPRCWPRGRW